MKVNSIRIYIDNTNAKKRENIRKKNYSIESIEIIMLNEIYKT